MYKPYPIFDMRVGKVTSYEPWLLPKDGFETFKNCHLKHGVLEKRRGYSFFGQICHINTTTKAPTLQTDPVMGIWNYYSGSTEQLIVMDKKRVMKYLTSRSVNKAITAFADAGGGEVTVTCTAHGLSTNDIVTISGTTNYNGTFNITKVDANNFKITDTWVSDDATGRADQEPFLDLTRNKIRFKHGGVQVHTLLVGDTLTGASSGATATVEAIIVDTGTWAGNDANGTIILTNGTLSGTFQDEDIEDGDSNVVGHVYGASTDDEFTGDNTNYFWVENWNEISYLTNNNDVIQKYNGTNLSRLHIDLDVEGGPDNDVTRCKLIFVLGGRLVIFDTDEKGTTYRQRARWCESLDIDTWKSASYLDADTDEHIIGADMLRDDIIVWFERSVWKFSYTADPNQPFRWDKIDSVEGCYATMSILPFSDELICVGPTKIVATDGREAYGIDERIPDIILDWHQDSVSYCYGLVLDEERQGWEAYASMDASANADGNTYPDSALIINYEDNSWSRYTLPIHTLGYSNLESDLTWNDVSEAWENIDWAWNDKSLQSGYPTTLMGSQDGKTYKLNDTGADDGSAIHFQAISGRWNPFSQEGRKARLGKIDFLVDVEASVSFDVKSYINTESTEFQTKTITCTALEGGADKAWHSVYVNAEAWFHRIEITNNAVSQRPRIHCIIPWFERGGRVQ